MNIDILSIFMGLVLNYLLSTPIKALDKKLRDGMTKKTKILLSIVEYLLVIIIVGAVYAIIEITKK